VPDDQLVGDVGAAAKYLRALANSNQKVGVIGYCSGGRQSVLAACSLNLDAAVDCYGAFVVESRPESTMTSIVDLLPNLSCPLLGLFGIEDQYPSPEQTVTLRELLTKHGKDFTFHEYDGADTPSSPLIGRPIARRWRPKRGARFGSSTAATSRTRSRSTCARTTLNESP